MSDVIIRDKAEYHTRTTDEMERHLSLPPWSLRQKMALACRILAAEGHDQHSPVRSRRAATNQELTGC